MLEIFEDSAESYKIGLEKAFIEDIIKVYEKHNLSIAHEDCHGAFIIEELDQWNIDWLKDSLR